MGIERLHLMSFCSSPNSPDATSVNNHHIAPSHQHLHEEHHKYIESPSCLLLLLLGVLLLFLVVFGW
ncbi:hypothetical protein BC941DRAFT_433612 [Chlamydoabsidia padenii]|nr:hypothetical protein BC941DRAFT_433612 [Chlamydoabsidia padenii]